jgi:hypothetical protein
MISTRPTPGLVFVHQLSVFQSALNQRLNTSAIQLLKMVQIQLLKMVQLQAKNRQQLDAYNIAS